MDEIVLQELEISGIRVLKVKKGQQIVYKLANNVSVNALNETKRQQIMQSIMRLHAQDSVNRSERLLITLSIIVL